MKKNKILSAGLALLLGWSGTAFAQSEVDALRYSRLGVAGSARIQGMGGAQTALGADISAMNANPAGLGMFRRSEFSVTPALQFNTTDTRANAGGSTDSRDMFTIPNMGIVFSNRKGDDDDSDWRGTTFGISLTRLNNFNQQLRYNNISEAPNTIVDYFAELANNNGRTESSLINEVDNNNIISLEGLAYGTYLIEFWDIEQDKATTFANPLYSYGAINQQEEIQRRGSQNQYDFGVGTSYKDKLYLGASIGIVTSKFTQKSYFRESGNYTAAFGATPEDDLNGQYNLTLYDEFTSKGTGVNLRVGAIARPIDALRIGLSIQTPTAYTFTDDYQRSLTAATINPDNGQPETYTESELPGQFTYQLTTPFRANGGLAVFLGKYGFIAADIEYVDYNNMRFSEEEDDFGSTGNYFDNVNKTISSTYKSAWNYKIGAEGRLDVFRFRAGYAVSGDPYRNAASDNKIKSFTLGTGIRFQNYYLDAAYVNSKGKSLYSPYTFSSGGGEPIVNIDNKQNTVAVTFGFNF